MNIREISDEDFEKFLKKTTSLAMTMFFVGAVAGFLIGKFMP